MSDIVWNNTYHYWEVSFQTSGFGGYFVKTNGVLGVNDPSVASGISVYPNPASNWVNVNLGRFTKANVTIYDASGKLVKNASINAGQYKLDISDLVKGTYVFNIVLEDNSKFVKKVIKE